MLFPTVVIDDFFKDPYKIRSYALEQKFFNCREIGGNWPGRRTQSLLKLNPDLTNEISLKILSVFYGCHAGASVEYEVDLYFQLIEPFEYRDINEGWVHKDRCMVSGIIYLNPNDTHLGGTSIYQPVEFISKGLPQIPYNDFDKHPTNIYLNAIKENNSKFKETIKISNVFNRMVMFDGKCPHGVPMFTNGEESRLTLVYFFHKVSASTFPIPNTRNFLI